MSWSTAAESPLCVLTTLALAAFAGAAHADAPPPATPCSIVAFVEETDPAGLNVRAAPNSKARVLGTLPPVWVDKASGTWIRIRVEITASDSGWFRIRNARDDEDLTGQPPRPTFSGEGWVSGRKLVVKPQARVGRGRPDAQAPVWLQLNDEQMFDSDVMVSASSLAACQGQWAQVEYVDAKLPAEERKALNVAPAARAGLPPGRFRLWMDKICGSQETVCDGL